MKKKLLIFLYTFLSLILFFEIPAYAQSKREQWLNSVTNWCATMEKDGNWKYYSGNGEITDYLKNRSTQRYSNCALMISHALQSMGVLKQNQKIYAKVSGNDIRTVYSGSGCEAAIKNNCTVLNIHGALTVTELINRGWIVKGDILCFYGMQHTAVYMGTDGNNSYWLDAGRTGTSTGKAGGIWNKSFSLIRIRDARYLTSNSWKVNDILRFPKEEIKAAQPVTSLSIANAAKTTTQKTTKNTTVAKTSPVTKNNSHRSPSVNKISYKIKKNKLYITFTVKNNCKTKEKITMSYFLGTKTFLGTGKSKKTFTLKPGKTKTFKNVCVSLNSVNPTRCYLSLKMKSHKSSSLVMKCKVNVSTTDKKAYKTANSK